MTNEYYELDELLEIFEQNERKSLIDRQRVLEDFTRTNPHFLTPVEELEDFNLQKTLKTIVKEIIEINETLEKFNEYFIVSTTFDIFLEIIQNNFDIQRKMIDDLDRKCKENKSS